MRKILILAFCLWLIPQVSLADTHTAATCSETDVQTAVTAAADGDIVSVPAGTATYTTGVAITAKAISVQGAGIGITTITTSGSTIYAFTISANAGTISDPVRITGFSFTGTKAVRVHNGTISQFRIDNCSFQNMGVSGKAPVCIGNIGSDPLCHATGVIDHCTFHDIIGDACIDVAWDNADAWARDQTLGTSDAVFVEDNTFVWDFCATTDPCDHIIAGNYGARYVFRYNTVTICGSGSSWMAQCIDAHGYCHGDADGRGTVSTEVYQNTVAGTSVWVFAFLRGGKGAFYSNTITGTFSAPSTLIYLTEYRARDSLCATCQGGCAVAYPAQDQINNYYIWSNTYNGAASSGVVMTEDHVPDYIQITRDFWNSAMPGYVAYTYPHQSIPRTVTIAVNGGNGSGAVDGVAGSGLVVYGATAAITFTPASGFHTESVTPVGCTTDWVSGDSCTTSAITADATVTVAFAPDAGTPNIGITLGGTGLITRTPGATGVITFSP